MRNLEVRSLLSNSILTFALRVLAALCVYLTLVLLARSMPPSVLGQYVVVQAGLWLTASIATLGLASAANRFIPAALAREKGDEVAAYILWARKMVLISGLGIGAAAALVVWLFDPQFASPYSPLIMIAAASVPLAALLSLNGQIARALDWIAFSSLTSTFMRPFLLLILVVGLQVAFDVELNARIVMLLQLALLAGVLAFQSALLTVKLSRLQLPANGLRRANLWLGTALILLLSEVYFGFYIDIHILIAGTLLPAADVAIFNAVLRTLSVAAFASAAVGIAFRPRVAHLFENPDRDRMRTAARQAIAITFWPAVALIALILPVLDIILSLFGPEYVAGKTAFVIAACAQLAIAFATPLVPMLGMTGHHTELFWISLFIGILAVAAHILLTPVLGINGSAAALLLSSIAWSLVLFVRVERNLGISLFASSVGRN
jgi:O-antigen/teichoic acid export membrane protein